MLEAVSISGIQARGYCLIPLQRVKGHHSIASIISRLERIQDIAADLEVMRKSIKFSRGL